MIGVLSYLNINMNNKTIQTRNILATVLEKAEYRAISDGLSSVQDAVRIFLSKYANGEIQIGFNYQISKAKESEYLKDSEEIERNLASGKVKTFNKTKDLLSTLKNE
jgi:antitoxin component of RelBE/YafQ-DinJ toxin-antitoxin module